MIYLAILLFLIFFFIVIPSLKLVDVLQRAGLGNNKISTIKQLIKLIRQFLFSPQNQYNNQKEFSDNRHQKSYSSEKKDIRRETFSEHKIFGPNEGDYIDYREINEPSKKEKE